MEDNKQQLPFNSLQQAFKSCYPFYFNDKMAAKTVIIIPGLSLDQEILGKIKGIIHYEERMLSMLMLLKMPNTHLIFLTSIPIDPVIIDYYLHLLPGITGHHARSRLTLLSCFDASRKSLAEKILERPRLIKRINNNIPPNHFAHLCCFNVTEYEKKLSEMLQVPIYGCDPALQLLGTKSSSRKIFKSCNIRCADGFENLETEKDIIDSLVKLKIQNPFACKAVVKINDGFSGEGNAIFSFTDSPCENQLHDWIKNNIRLNFKIVAEGVSYYDYMEKFRQYGGVVELFIEGYPKYSPSVQCRINPLGEIEIISTHDQLLGEESGQVFIGANFPANPEYGKDIATEAYKISEVLKRHSVMGRYSIDFISVKEDNIWKHYAIEINLRKGGTTHPYNMLQFLTNGRYDVEKATYFTATGQPRYYVCTDNLQRDCYKGLTPYDLIDIMTPTDLLFNATTQEGVMFHMIGALSQYGKLGLVCIGRTPARAGNLYRETVRTLNKATRLPKDNSKKENVILLSSTGA
jgi:hypothetical protein